MTISSRPPYAGRVRAARSGDRLRWGELYRAYADFYGVEQSAESADRVWSWIADPGHEVSCLVAEDEGGRVVGLAHYRPFARPLSASTGCFLDDLFVDPAVRGGGTADALLTHLRRLAGANGWSVVRWVTAETNYRGRAKYDQYATRTSWITYDITPGDTTPGDRTADA